MATSGILRLTIIEAKLTRDTEFFSKMDPFVKISMRDQNYKTKVLQGGGKLPKWNETFDLDVKYVGDDMHVEVRDEDVTASDLIGECTIKLSSLCINGGLDDWFDIQYKGKKSGTIHLKGVWTPIKAPGTATATTNPAQVA
jgi:Ca2+-dependent lipid-binding protein